MKGKIDDLGDGMKDDSKMEIDTKSEKEENNPDSMAKRGNKEPDDTEEMEGL